MSPVRLLADDLTGALDAAVRLAPLAGELPVVWDRDAALAEAGSLALATNTRDVSTGEAAKAIAALGRFWRAEALSFKKIDSLWRGNTLGELVALIESDAFATVVIASAFPEQNRITRGGRQYWRRAADEGWQPVTQDLRAGLAQRRIDVGVAGRHALPPSGFSGVWIFDAETGADLDAIASLARNAPAPVLWCGTAGLAGALAGPARAAPPARVDAPVTIIVGSNHPVSRDQVLAVKADSTAAVLEIGADAQGWDELIARAAAQAAARQSVVLWFSPGLELAPAQAEAAMMAFLERLAPRFRPPGALLVTGGETLFRLCRAAGATRLLPHREISPGIATARIADGRWGGLSLISKSGAFGATDFLCELLRKGSL